MRGSARLAGIDRDLARLPDGYDTQLSRVHLDEDDDERAGVTLSGRQWQRVAPARSLMRADADLLILDEPTAALEKREIERLFAVLTRMKAQGTAIIYISHHLDEVVTIADRCTILRDGRVAAVSRRGAFSAHDLVAAMTGRAAQAAVVAPFAPGELLLQARPDGVAALTLRAGGCRLSGRRRRSRDQTTPCRRRQGQQGDEHPRRSPAVPPVRTPPRPVHADHFPRLRPGLVCPAL